MILLSESRFRPGRERPGGPDVSSEDELGCPTCRGYTWVFAFLLGRRNLCGILFCRGCDFEFSLHGIQTIGLKFTIDKYIASIVPFRVLSRTNLAERTSLTSSISFISFRLRALKLSCRSFSHHAPLFSITSALFLQNTRGGIPLREFARCTEAQKCLFVSPLLATLTHSVSRNSFPCHSYANPRDMGVTAPNFFLPFTPILEGPPLTSARSVSCSVPLCLCANFQSCPAFVLQPDDPISSIFDGSRISFRINTCKSVSKQTTSTPFRINTCEKHREGEGYC